MDRNLSPLVEFLTPYPESVQELAIEARNRLQEIAGPANDLYFDATSAVSAGLSYTGHPRDNFINIAVYSKHVTLIFPFGARLTDPELRLKGEGKQIRNLRLDGIETLNDLYVVDLILQSVQFAARPPEPIAPPTFVKVYSGPKRRPTNPSRDSQV
ncbi:MAG: hypothetical protein JST40_12935 [Armatimonadetes bacterium]|nr:hypothetical protein [Armatimonadota bacterium]